MKTGNIELRDQLKAMVRDEIQRLAGQSDVLVFTLYTDDTDRPLRREIHERRNGDLEDYQVSLDYEGIGVWHICRRDGKAFSARHILLKSEGGRFIHQRAGTFEGYWADWRRYVMDDKWVQTEGARKRGGSRILWRFRRKVA